MLIETEFQKRFGPPVEARFFSPGRVNLIGEHIDYCGGRVLPMAINRGTSAVAAKNTDGLLRIYSERFDEVRELPLTHGKPSGSWTDFAVGVVALLLDDYELSGVDLHVTSNIGAGGLSSSASFALLLAHALLWASDVSIAGAPQRLALAKLCQQVEHEFVGVNCGIMDQASIALGGIMTLDCASLNYQSLEANFGDYTLVVMDTCHQRTLAGSKYNERVAELAEIKRLLAAQYPVNYLCDLTVDQLADALGTVRDKQLGHRLKHVVTENHRVSLAAEALDKCDLTGFGELMNLSHDSLREDYEVTGPALDAIVTISRQQVGTVGARMTGAGFGGCALAMVESSRVEAHNQAVITEFEVQTGVVPSLFSVAPAIGAGQV